MVERGTSATTGSDFNNEGAPEGRRISHGAISDALAGEGYSYVSVSVALDANGNVTSVSITVNDNSASDPDGDQGSAGDPANYGFLPDITPPPEPQTLYIAR